MLNYLSSVLFHVASGLIYIVVYKFSINFRSFPSVYILFRLSSGGGGGGGIFVPTFDNTMWKIIRNNIFNR